MSYYSGIAHRNMQNAHAFKQILKNIYTPDAALGVGIAEDLQDQPLAFELAPPAIKAYDHIEPMILEETRHIGRGKNVTDDVFPSTGWLGNILEEGY